MGSREPWVVSLALVNTNIEHFGEIAYGTGVLTKWNGQNFLLTARHNVLTMVTREVPDGGFKTVTHNHSHVFIVDRGITEDMITANYLLNHGTEITDWIGVKRSIFSLDMPAHDSPGTDFMLGLLSEDFQMPDNYPRLSPQSFDIPKKLSKNLKITMYGGDLRPVEVNIDPLSIRSDSDIFVREGDLLVPGYSGGPLVAEFDLKKNGIITRKKFIIGITSQSSSGEDRWVNLSRWRLVDELMEKKTLITVRNCKKLPRYQLPSFN